MSMHAFTIGRIVELAIAIVLLAFAGLMLLVPSLAEWAGRLFQPIATRASGALPTGDGFLSGVALGAALSVVWTPCAGPILAAVTALARYTLRTAAVRRRSPAAILRWVGEAMLHQEAAGGRFCTIACAHLDLTRTPARITVACGGHPLPLVVHPDGRVTPVGRLGTLLGSDIEPLLTDVAVTLGRGEVLVLYTDGVTERRRLIQVVVDLGQASSVGRPGLAVDDRPEIGVDHGDLTHLAPHQIEDVELPIRRAQQSGQVAHALEIS